MANSLAVSININAVQLGVPFNINASLNRAPAANLVHGEIVSVPTTTQALSIGSVAAPGVIYIKNLDATNPVDLSVDNASATPFATLAPGDSIVIPAKSTTTYYTKASGAAVNLQVQVFPI